MKIKKMLVLLVAISSLFVSQAQKTIDYSNSTQEFNTSQLNLPPNLALSKKLDVNADYWEKLSLIPNEAPSNSSFEPFLKDVDVDEAQNDYPELYNYYMEAQEFHDSLSNKVKVTFTHEELWRIYMFNQELKQELIKIKD